MVELGSYVCVAEIGTIVVALKHKTMKQFASFVGYETKTRKENKMESYKVNLEKFLNCWK